MFNMKANNVKVGDKLIDTKGRVWTVDCTDDTDQPCRCFLEEAGFTLWFYNNGFGNISDDYEIVGFAPEPIEEPKQTANKPHKHKDLIIAYANGAKIEYYHPTDNEWYGTSNPDWYEHIQYRIKPEPKPDVVKYMGLDCNIMTGIVESGDFWGDFATVDHWDNQIKLTFCGDTGKLKSAEVIN